MTYFIDPSNTIKEYKYCENSFLPHSVIIPLNINSNKDYKSFVKVGDEVKEGEIIGYTTYRDDTMNIHASIPGKVTDIIPCDFSNGTQGYGIKISIGGKFSYLGKKITPKNTDDFTKDKVISTLRKHSVINTFNLRNIESLGNQFEKKSDAKNLVVRLFDEDNYRITDSLNSKFYFPKILEASKLLQKVFNFEGVLFAIDQKCQNKEEIKSSESDFVKVVEMNIKKYPNGTQREILSAYNRNYRKNSKLSISGKDIFIDSTTLLDVYSSILLDTPVINKNVYFSGNCLNATSFLNVRVGTTIRDMVTQLGGFVKNPQMIIVNGIISGFSVHNLDVPISKSVKSVSFVSKANKNDENIYSCVNCGNCRFICPKKISPDIIYKHISNFKKVPEFAAKVSLACSDCGLCNTVCPSRLPLCQTIHAYKEKTLSQE